jgi:murein L,D-transpeptidase YafK
MFGCRRYLVVVLALIANIPATSAEIVVSKSARTLEYDDGDAWRLFPIGLGSVPIGPKRRQGDRRTPEGVYRVTQRNSHSQYYLSLGISYPNDADAEQGLRAGIISKREHDAIHAANRDGRPPPQGTRLGGNIFIHGRGAGADWTWGCIALDDADMKFLFEHVRVGDKVTILE